jgi:inosine-uridine nucleoside N-ribohydrolase
VDEVFLLHFRSPFFEEYDEIREIAKAEWAGASFRTQSLKKDYRRLANILPGGCFSLERSCGACRRLILARALRYMKRIEADFIVTGELVGQRGLSAEEMERIAESLEIGDLILRPLSARLLAPTRPEKEGWVDRDYLGDLAVEDADRLPGVARRLGLSAADPMCGDLRCKLTFPGFGRRLEILFEEEGFTMNALKLLEFLGIKDVPVARGAEHPLLRELRDAEGIHGKTGLGDAVLPEPKLKTDSRGAVELILEKASELGKELTIVTIGPLTNVASAILADTSLPRRIGGLVMMGGAFNLTPYGVGNVNAVAEFNVWHDPEAAKIVFDSGVPIVAAGLDVTTQPENRLSEARFEEMVKKGTKRAKLVGDLCRNMVHRFNGFSLHDPIAICYVVDPTLFRIERHRVEIETKGELTLGMTIIEKRDFHRAPAKANVDIIVSIDATRFLDLCLGRIIGKG